MGNRRVIRSTTATRAVSGCDQSALRTASTNVSMYSRCRSKCAGVTGLAVSDVKGRVSGQFLPQALEVTEPLLVETVGEVGVLPVVHLVAEEHRSPLVSEEPDAVVGRLARAEVEHSEGCTAELQPLPVHRGAVRERALRGPFVSEHRAQDLLLERVVAADHGVDARRCDDGHVIAGDQLHDAAVVVGMRVGDEHRQQWLAQDSSSARGGRGRRRP